MEVDIVPDDVALGLTVTTDGVAVPQSEVETDFETAADGRVRDTLPVLDGETDCVSQTLT